MENKNRSQFNHILFASNGQGKTTFEIEIAINYLKNDLRKRVLFLLPDDGEEKLYQVKEIEINELQSFKGVAKLFVDSQKIFDTFLDIYSDENNKFNGLCICDDLGGVIGKRPEALYRLFRRRRQCNIDFLWSFHGLHCDAPKGFYTYLNNIYLFRTSDNHEQTQKNLPIQKQAEFFDAYFRVQEKSEEQFNYKEEIIINPLKYY